MRPLTPRRHDRNRFSQQVVQYPDRQHRATITLTSDRVVIIIVPGKDHHPWHRDVAWRNVDMRGMRSNACNPYRDDAPTANPTDRNASIVLLGRARYWRISQSYGHAQDDNNKNGRPFYLKLSNS